MWCNDPDKAFDIRCDSLGCEDSCKDNSNCPIQRKDKTMYLIIKKEISTDVIDESETIIQISKDRKRFAVIKHNKFTPSEGKEYHISELKNILLV